MGSRMFPQKIKQTYNKSAHFSHMDWFWICISKQGEWILLILWRLSYSVPAIAAHCSLWSQSVILIDREYFVHILGFWIFFPLILFPPIDVFIVISEAEKIYANCFKINITSKFVQVVLKPFGSLDSF